MTHKRDRGEKLFEVVIISNAVVKHTYEVEAISKAQAVEKVKAGMVEAVSEEVYGEEETDVEVSPLSKRRSDT